VNSEKAHIGVIGIGKLGLCFALNLEAVGYKVSGFDISPKYVAILQQRQLRSHEPGVEAMLRNAQHFHPTDDCEALLASDIRLFFVVVATPSLPDGGYDHSQVDFVLERFKAAGRKDFVRDIVVMCTTMPGYCDQAAQGLEEINCRLSYNPEFIAQGTIIRDQQYPDQVLIGEADEEAGDAIQAVYERMCRNTPSYCRMSRLSAEITKLATNCFLTTKISFANSIGDLALKAGAEPDKILAAIGADKRIGGRYLGYGFGYGGPCFPRDNRALGKFGEEIGMEVLISKATDEVNRRHLEFQLTQYLAQYPANATIVFDTVTYKPGTTILEESQQLALALRLAQAGRRVRVRDLAPVVSELKAQYGDLFEYEIMEA
jgi:nucleotide sugar dehydrogenase